MTSLNMLLQLEKLPRLPPNAKYVQHKNECYDWGTFGWLLLKSGHVSPSKYKFIVLTNSSVRGPYLPREFFHVQMNHDCCSASGNQATAHVPAGNIEMHCQMARLLHVHLPDTKASFGSSLSDLPQLTVCRCISSNDTWLQS